MTGRAGPLRSTVIWASALRYARAHHLLQLAVGLSAATATAYWAASRELVLPAATTQGWVEMASMVFTAVPFAALTAGSLHSSMASLEQAASAVLRRAELTQLALLTLLSCGLFSAATYAGGNEVHGGTLAEAVRNLLLYLGMALLSARLFGRSLAWVLPLADFVVAGYWGTHDGGVPRWWAWQFHSYTGLPAWTATFGMLVAGSAAMWFSPWRLRGLRPSIGKRR